ncbi:glutamine-hydrolyzing GMP synthase [Candidatus Methylacidithermus pantelleriae]|uniref:GMP synthase [glutamine-hydrolyzing] n=1 Tax=Candidatus Methylacidithermus pantelleriae TaxID=2744239 RepID=A0A8J2BGZ1_9BACT|nr:glutamine-hydrolyzing GMP synthase [Candidatus Methylacidithermus pantelleriae]CAF0688875.1 GMP synthetase [Candidatus Methylacidithermus pantelleriae]
MIKDRIAILDFGSQYTQLIARRIRELGVYSEIFSYKIAPEELLRWGARGVVLSGGPESVFGVGSPVMDSRILDLGLPVLGICYGLHLLVHLRGGRVRPSGRREYGYGEFIQDGESLLFSGLPSQFGVWNSHGDRVEELPAGFRRIGFTKDEPNAAIAWEQERLYGVQFHPEVSHTELGKEIFANFLFRICGVRPTWTLANFVEETLETIRREVGTKKVLMALSGGVDSSVCALLLHRAIGSQLCCVFVDTGLLRKGEKELVERVFSQDLGIRLRVVDAGARFLRRLRGVADPEKKRKIIGRTFISVFREVAREVGNVGFLAQGTLYPDVIESGKVPHPAHVIKSHHNVGGLPQKMGFRLLEPLRNLFKDEVRQLGKELGLPPSLLYRHPFPGPGLAVRCLAPVTPSNLETLRQADAVLLEEMERSGWMERVWQAFAVLLPVRAVGVMGDQRSYGLTVAIRVVQSQDGMTADWVDLPKELLNRIAQRIVAEVPEISRVTYDITSKPPGTIEWQ